jgi:hypothetical protein
VLYARSILSVSTTCLLSTFCLIPVLVSAFCLSLGVLYVKSECIPGRVLSVARQHIDSVYSPSILVRVASERVLRRFCVTA